MWQSSFTQLPTSRASTINSDELFIFGGVSIEKKIISQDIRSIILFYLSLNTTSFESFKCLWYERGFSLIHYICMQKSSRELFLEFIYNEILSYLLVSNTVTGRAAVIYALYLLRQSEPVGVSNLHLPIPINTRVILNELKESFDLFTSEQLIEPLYILRFLFTNDSFVYIQNQNGLLAISELHESSSILAKDSISPIVSNINQRYCILILYLIIELHNTNLLLSRFSDQKERPIKLLNNPI